MVTLSVVVPVHAVERYLIECLDSIRAGLRRNDLRFGPGWYEDVPFSHPVVLAAGRLAALDRVCYHYRIGRLAALYRRHRPAGYAPPSGSKGLKHRLVALDCYALYTLLRVCYRVSRGPERPPLVPAEVPYSTPQPQPASIL
jgi:hypothetical protein